MMVQEYRGRGRPRPEETIQRDREVLRFLADREGEITRNEVAEGLGYPLTQTWLSLDRLRTQGLVQSHYVGRATRWSATDAGRSWSGEQDSNARLRTAADLAESLCDSLRGDEWNLANAIVRLCRGEITPGNEQESNARLRTAADLAESLCDSLRRGEWNHANAIARLCRGEITPQKARAEAQR